MEKKKGRKPIDHEVLDFIRREAIKKRDTDRSELATNLESLLISRGIVDVPSFEYMKRIISNARVNDDGRNAESKALDEPWNLGSWVKWNEEKQISLSPEATGDLFELWAFCLSIGHKLTIRQAKYACYLRDTWKASWSDAHGKSDFSILYEWCQEYAIRERICNALNIDLNTSDLDAEISMAPSLEWDVVRVTKAVPSRLLKSFPISPTSLKDIPNVASTWGKRAGQIVEENLNIKGYGLKDYEGMSVFEDRVYAHWLRFLSKGPNWENMSREERQRIAERLKDALKSNSSPTAEILYELGYGTEILSELEGYVIGADSDNTQGEAQQ